MELIAIETHARVETVEVTADVREAAKRLGVENGAVLVFSPHTTAGVFINECYDPDVNSDIIKTLNKLIPATGDYAHSEGNSAAHIKTLLVGESVLIPVENGELVIGRWQGIVFAEFDGPRRRTLQVSKV